MHTNGEQSPCSFSPFMITVRPEHTEIIHPPARVRGVVFACATFAQRLAISPLALYVICIHLRGIYAPIRQKLYSEIEDAPFGGFPMILAGIEMNGSNNFDIHSLPKVSEHFHNCINIERFVNDTLIRN